MPLATIISVILSTLGTLVLSQSCIRVPCPYIHRCNPRNDSHLCQCPVIGEGNVSCINDMREICDYSNLDLVFLLETSGAASQRNWPVFIGLVLSVVDHLPMVNDSSRVAIVTFGDVARVQIPLKNYHNKFALMKAVSDLPRVFDNGGANISGALHFVRTGLLKGAMSESLFTRKEIVILLTSGSSTFDINLIGVEVNRADHSGIVLNVIGVGDPLNLMTVPTIQAIAAQFGNEQIYLAEDQRIPRIIPILLEKLCTFATEDPCTGVLCRSGQVCSPKGLTHRCHCPSGFAGRNCREDYSGVMTDIVFLLDSSTSVQAHNWYKILDFVSAIIGHLHLNQDQPRHNFAVITFSTSATVSKELAAYTDFESLSHEIELLPYIGGGTNTSGALRLMSQLFTPGYPGNRPGVQNIGILITDGTANIDTQKTLPEAAKARLQDVVIYAIGIGDAVNRDYLHGLTGGKNGNVFQAVNFEALDSKVMDTSGPEIAKEVTDSIFWQTWLPYEKIGPPGSKGPTGESGTLGMKGAPGIIGDQGKFGSKGFQGNQGITGITGAAGPSGITGIPGRRGSAGRPGLPGMKGIPGAPGHPGHPGIDGSIGQQGSPGVEGPRGFKGGNGEVGPTGTPGDSGARGQKGKSGAPGGIGMKGHIGPAGPQGFSGVEGQQGPNGFPGRTGPSGIRGPIPQDAEECLLESICEHRCVGYRCECYQGYKLMSDGIRCQDTDECLVNNGGCEHICKNENGSKTCACKFGFTLSRDTLTCVDVNECCNGKPIPDCGGVGKICINTYGSYICLNIPPGYYKDVETGALAAISTGGESLLNRDAVVVLLGWVSILTVLILITILMLWLADDILIRILAEGYRKAREIEKTPRDFFLFPKMPLSAQSTEKLNELCKKRSGYSGGQRYIDEHGFLTPKDPDARMFEKKSDYHDDDNNNAREECPYDPIASTSIAITEYENEPSQRDS